MKFFNIFWILFLISCNLSQNKLLTDITNDTYTLKQIYAKSNLALQGIGWTFIDSNLETKYYVAFFEDTILNSSRKGMFAILSIPDPIIDEKNIRVMPDQILYTTRNSASISSHFPEINEYSKFKVVDLVSFIFKPNLDAYYGDLTFLDNHPFGVSLETNSIVSGSQLLESKIISIWVVNENKRIFENLSTEHVYRSQESYYLKKE